MLALQKLYMEVARQSDFMGGLEKEVRAVIARYVFISNIGASTRIENAVLTNQEIEWLDDTLSKDGRPTAFEASRDFIENKISKDKERSLEEVVGCRELLQLIYREGSQLKPLTEATLRELHSILLQHYPKAEPYKGRYKIAPNSVVSINRQTGEQKPVLKTADPGHQTKIAMQTLVDWYNRVIDQHPWTLAVACEFVFRFLAIHPFQDGNGRMSRSLFSMILMQSPNVDLARLTPYLSIDRSIEEHKQEYYAVLRQCSGGYFHEDPQNYQTNYLLNFMIKMVESAVKDIPLYHQKHLAHMSLSQTAQRTLLCFKDNPQSRLATGDLIKLLGMPRRTVIFNVNQLLKLRFLQRYGQGAGVHYQLIF